MTKVRKFISLLLAVMMVVSVIAVSAVTTGALDLESNYIYFDVKSTGWDIGKAKLSFYIYSVTEGEIAGYGIGGKKTRGTLIDEENQIWEYDPIAAGMPLVEGEQYAIIFNAAGNETYSLLMDTSCIGHMAYADPDNQIENPVDSSKFSLPAYWKDLDSSKYGPRMVITSTGNVVGTCMQADKTPESMFTDFLTATGKEGIGNARIYSTKTEQQMIDDIGEALGLDKDFIQSAFDDNSVETTWDYMTSPLPAGNPGMTFSVSGTVTSYLPPDVDPEALDDNNHVQIEITNNETEEGHGNVAYGTSVDYIFSNLAIGTYTLTVSKKNHVTRTEEVVISAEDVVKNVKIHLIGDINGDGRITTVDFGKANSHARGKSTLTGYEFDCAEVTGDGKISTGDAGKINSAAKGKSSLWK